MARINLSEDMDPSILTDVRVTGEGGATAVAPVTVYSWPRSGRGANRVDRIKPDRVAGRLTAYQRQGRFATAEDDHGRVIGEVVADPDTGRLVWWAETPADSTREGEW